VELTAADRVLERRHDLAQPGELVPEELLVAVGGVRPDRREPAQIRLAIEGVLDGVASRVVFRGQAGAPPLDGRRQEGQPPPLMDAQLVQRARDLLEDGNWRVPAQSLPRQNPRR
jgi:hypothetical protein